MAARGWIRPDNLLKINPRLCRVELFCAWIFAGGKRNSFLHTGRVMDNHPVSFPEWKQALAKAGLGNAGEVADVREIITLLLLPRLFLLVRHAVRVIEMVVVDRLGLRFLLLAVGLELHPVFLRR